MFCFLDGEFPEELYDELDMLLVLQKMTLMKMRIRNARKWEVIFVFLFHLLDFSLKFFYSCDIDSENEDEVEMLNFQHLSFMWKVEQATGPWLFLWVQPLKLISLTCPSHRIPSSADWASCDGTTQNAFKLDIDLLKILLILLIFFGQILRNSNKKIIFLQKMHWMTILMFGMSCIHCFTSSSWICCLYGQIKVIMNWYGERSWSDMEMIKDGKRSNLNGDSLKKHSIPYTLANLEETRIWSLHECCNGWR